MANFLEYSPEQAYLLPPTVREVSYNTLPSFICCTEGEDEMIRIISARKASRKERKRYKRKSCERIFPLGR